MGSKQQNVAPSRHQKQLKQCQFNPCVLFSTFQNDQIYINFTLTDIKMLPSHCPKRQCFRNILKVICYVLLPSPGKFYLYSKKSRVFFFRSSNIIPSILLLHVQLPNLWQRSSNSGMTVFFINHLIFSFSILYQICLCN